MLDDRQTTRHIHFSHLFGHVFTHDTDRDPEGVRIFIVQKQTGHRPGLGQLAASHGLRQLLGPFY